MNSINMWGKIQKGEGTKREEISKGSNKLSVSTFAVKRTPRKNSGSLLNGENKFLPDESQKSEMFSAFSISAFAGKVNYDWMVDTTKGQ